MNDYLSKMHSSIPNPAWGIPNFHFGEAVRMPAHSVMYKHVYKDELERIGQEIAWEEAKWYEKAIVHWLFAKASSEQAVKDFAEDTVNDTMIW